MRYQVIEADVEVIQFDNGVRSGYQYCQDLYLRKAFMDAMVRHSIMEQARCIDQMLMFLDIFLSMMIAARPFLRRLSTFQPFFLGRPHNLAWKVPQCFFLPVNSEVARNFQRMTAWYP